MKIYFVIMLVALSGCVNRNGLNPEGCDGRVYCNHGSRGIISYPDGRFSYEKESVSSMASGEIVKIELIKDAEKFCIKRDKKFILRGATSNGKLSGVYGVSSAEISFTCE